MHILLIVNGYVTPDNPSLGAAFRLHVQAYRQFGWQVGVIASLQRTGTRLQRPLLSGPWTEIDEDYGAPVYRDYAWRLLNPLRLGVTLRARIAARVVSRYIKRHGRPDVIHAHGSRYSGIVAAIVKEKIRIPYVLTEHMSTLPRGLVRLEEVPLISQGFEFADARLPVSPELGKALEATLGEVARPWVAVPNMVDGEFFRPAPRKGFRASKSDFVFIHISRMDEVKAQGNLLKAFALRFKNKAKVRLRLGGDGALGQQLRALAQHLGVDGQVDFLGPLSREAVAVEMQRVGAYVLSSHYETFGIPLIEALACGKPVVATACGGPQSIVNDRNGILVPPNDIDALSEAMGEIYQQIDKYDPVVLREDCLSRFGTKAVTEIMAKIYSDVLNSKT